MSAALAGQGVNLRRNRANLRDDAAMHLSFAREKIRCGVGFVDVLVSPPTRLRCVDEEDRCRSDGTPRAPLWHLLDACDDPSDQDDYPPPTSA